MRINTWTIYFISHTVLTTQLRRVSLFKQQVVKKFEMTSSHTWTWMKQSLYWIGWLLCILIWPLTAKAKVDLNFILTNWNLPMVVNGFLEWFDHSKSLSELCGSSSMTFSNVSYYSWLQCLRRKFLCPIAHKEDGWWCSSIHFPFILLSCETCFET